MQVVYLQNVPIKVHTICTQVLIVGIPPPHFPSKHLQGLLIGSSLWDTAWMWWGGFVCGVVWSLVKGQPLVLPVVGVGMRLISPYKTICVNKHNDYCHMENFHLAKKRLVRMSCLAAWNVRLFLKSNETGILLFYSIDIFNYVRLTKE
jgi:hypothetical protein